MPNVVSVRKRDAAVSNKVREITKPDCNGIIVLHQRG
jgi:hypothetical protein